MVNPKIEDCRKYIENAANPQVAGYSLSKTEAVMEAPR
jgi:hypothetical protein